MGSVVNETQAQTGKANTEQQRGGQTLRQTDRSISMKSITHCMLHIHLPAPLHCLSHQHQSANDQFVPLWTSLRDLNETAIQLQPCRHNSSAAQEKWHFSWSWNCTCLAFHNACIQMPPPQTTTHQHHRKPKKTTTKNRIMFLCWNVFLMMFSHVLQSTSQPSPPPSQFAQIFPPSGHCVHQQLLLAQGWPFSIWLTAYSIA